MAKPSWYFLILLVSFFMTIKLWLTLPFTWFIDCKFEKFTTVLGCLNNKTNKL